MGGDSEQVLKTSTEFPKVQKKKTWGQIAPKICSIFQEVKQKEIQTNKEIEKKKYIYIYIYYIKI